MSSIRMGTVSSSSRTSPPAEPTIRRGNRQDVRFLRDMLRHAFYWRSGGTVEDASLWRYVSGWGRRGDAAVVALEGGFPIGAAWFRLFARDEPGFGFVDEQTPEVSIAVVPSRRVTVAPRSRHTFGTNSTAARARSEGQSLVDYAAAVEAEPRRVSRRG